MKTRVNLTVDESVLNSMKAYAEKKHISVSELVEKFFMRITKPAAKKNILNLVEELKPSTHTKGDLKERFYTEQAKKYGF